MGDGIPAIYAETMDKFRHPSDWDVLGIVAEVVERLISEGDPEAAAVIDSLMVAIRDVSRNGNDGMERLVGLARHLDS